MQSSRSISEKPVPVSGFYSDIKQAKLLDSNNVQSMASNQIRPEVMQSLRSTKTPAEQAPVTCLEQVTSFCSNTAQSIQFENRSQNQNRQEMIQSPRPVSTSAKQVIVSDI